MAFKTVIEFGEDLPNLRSWDSPSTKKWFRDVISSSCTGMENTANTIQVSADEEIFAEDYPYRCIEFTGNQAATVLFQKVPKNQTMSFKELSPTPGTHTVTLVDGTFDGTNNTATFNALNQCIIVHFDSNNDGILLANAGTVVLSST